MRKSIPIFKVDSFTSEPFSGNPAGVCLLDGPAEDWWMQAVAAEMNVSETAFLWPGEDGLAIRYFTPTVEVELCGHATLASAAVLWSEGLAELEQEIPLRAKGGQLLAARDGEWIRMDFPSDPVRPTELLPGLLDAARVSPRASYKGKMGWWLLELEKEKDVRSARPDFAALRAGGFDPLIITAAGDAADYDFVSRFFAPTLGVDEDPVTGAAHTTLGPFWSEKLGKPEVVGFQASRRGGVVRVRPRGERVDLFGQAVLVLKGSLVV